MKAALSVKAIIAGAVIHLLLGPVVYAEGVLGTYWLAGQGKVPADVVPTAAPFIFAILASLGLATALNVIISLMKPAGILAGGLIGLSFGVAMTVLPIITHYSFLDLNFAVIAVDAGKELVGAFVVGLVITWLACPAASLKPVAA